MASKDKQTKLEDNDSYSKKQEEERFIIEPKTTKEQETEFIKKTMEMSKDNKEKAKKKKKNTKTKKSKEKQKNPKKKNRDSNIKNIDDVEESLEKEIEVRKIIEPSFPKKTIKKTTDLFGKGFHYFIDLEEKLTQDFLFGYLPEKIKKYIKIIIPFLFMFLILTLLVEIDYHIRRAFALFVCIALLWALESISMIVTALLIPVLAVMLGLIKNTNPFDSFSNPIIYLLLSGLIIAQAFRKHDLDRYLAVKMMALSKGKVKRLLFFMMFISALLGMWMSNTATIALMIPVILSISSEINHNTEKNYTSMFLLSSGFAAGIGGLSTIIGGNPNAITAAFLSNTGRFEFLDWSIIGFPLSIVMFVVAYITFSKIYKVKKEKIDISELKEEARTLKFNHQQKKILLIFIPTILAWLFGAKLFAFLQLPSDFFRTEVVGLSAAILFFAFKILRWEDVRGIPWEVFLLVGGGLTLGQILIDTGAASFLAVGLFSKLSILPKPLIILFLVALAMVLANFVNNSSTTIILVPVLIHAFPYLNINVKLMAMTVAMATAISPLTPIAMPGFSLIYGTGKVRRSEMIKTGLKVAMFCGPIMALMIAGINWFFF